jgi:hypothetical protein
VRLSQPLLGDTYFVFLERLGDTSVFFRCMFGSIDVPSGGPNRNLTIPTRFRLLIIVRLQHLPLLPRCYQDRTTQPHLDPCQETPGLLLLVGLGPFFPRRWELKGSDNLKAWSFKGPSSGSELTHRRSPFDPSGANRPQEANPTRLSVKASGYPRRFL